VVSVDPTYPDIFKIIRAKCPKDKDKKKKKIQEIIDAIRQKKFAISLWSLSKELFLLVVWFAEIILQVDGRKRKVTRCSKMVSRKSIII